MKLIRIIFSLAVLLCSFTLLAQNRVDQFVANPSFRNSNISILVKDLQTGKEICSYRPNNAAIPASILKVVTTATALEMLGPDFRYETEIAYDGSISDDGVLNGNIYIRGSGDPTLGSLKMGDRSFLSKWVAAIKNAGIKKINGSIIADESRFDNEGVNARWTWDDIGNYYASGIYALAYMDNTMRVTFKSNTAGTTPDIINISPEVDGLFIENNLISSRISFDSAYFYGSPKNLYRSVRGEIPANKPGFTVKAELPNPGLTLVKDLNKELLLSGIEVAKQPSELKIEGLTFPNNKPSTSKLLIHYSVPLSQIIKEINVNSNNFYAEQLFKSLSLQRVAVATNKTSSDIIRSFWKAKGFDTNQLSQADGSGLSPTNAVSSSFFVDVMEYMYTKSKYKEVFFNSLPIAGKSGTLAGFLIKSPLKGKVYAKSGTINRVKTYTGYIIQDNKKWVFSIMVNYANGSSWSTLGLIEDFLTDISK